MLASSSFSKAKMAYNLYQVQMAQAWTERVKKENAMAERFWATRKSDDLMSEVVL